MQKKRLNTGLSLLVAAAFLLSACGSSTPVAPTLDANAIYTQAAATVASGMAQTEAAQPSATPASATSTPTNIVPTLNATQPLATAGTPVSGTLLAGTPASGTKAATLPAGTIVINLTKIATTPGALFPTNTVAVAVPVSNDKASWYDQTPKDGTVEKANDKFTVSYIIKNVGKTTWSTGYTLRYYAGDQMGSPAAINLPKTVPPGDSVQISFELTSPNNTGKYNTMWVMTNTDGVNFYSVYLTINVE